MSVSSSENLVYGLKLSSVVPAKMTGEGKVHELKGVDLAMKLHYLKGVYFFSNNNNNNNNGITSAGNSATSFLSIGDLKNHMFAWLESYFMTCGRLRTSPEDGRLVIKLNDAGVRIVEAQASKTVEEWLAMKNLASLNDHLIYTDHVLGPDLGFSPLVFIQVTWFKCGGIALGLSWAHILGDVFSASTFMNKLGLYMRGHHKSRLLALPKSVQPQHPPLTQTQEPLSIKRINPVGDYWVAPTNCKMGIHSFYLIPKQLDQVYSYIHGPRTVAQCFEIISAIIWKSIAKIREDLEPQVVTLCRPKSLDRENVVPHNGQVIGTVKSNSRVSTTDLPKLVNLIDAHMVDECDMLDNLATTNLSTCDCILYGANLTFVDMERANIYGFELKGQQPAFASYTVGGIGDEGAVFVLPGPNDRNGDENGNKLIILVLPQNEIEQVKLELENEWHVA